MNIDEMAAGREMDVLIQIEIFQDDIWDRARAAAWANDTYLARRGHCDNPHVNFDSYYDHAGGEYYISPEDDLSPLLLRRVPHFSTDIAATCKIIQCFTTWNSPLLLASHHHLILEWVGGGGDNEWACTLGDKSNRTCAASVPLAICRAALKAVKGQSPEGGAENATIGKAR